ncbi:hypothetical protein L0156_23010, partial [bacterium]|nr:hypothetical protein [bacterium]
CEVDRKTDTPASKFYMQRNEKYTSPRVYIKRLSRTAVSRHRATTGEGLLHTLEVMTDRMELDEEESAGSKRQIASVFQTQIVADECLIPVLKEQLPKIFSVGSGRSRGMGKVQFKWNDEQPFSAATLNRLPELLRMISHSEATGEDANKETRDDDLTDRLIRFNTYLRKEREAYDIAKQLQPDAALYFTIDLLSDAILVDDGAPTLALFPNMFLKKFGGSIDLVHSYVEPRIVRGWSEAHGLPKQTMLASRMGGVFLYRVKTNHPDDIEEIVKMLAEIETIGVGLFTEIGYGHVRVCSPFHREVEPV